MNKQIEEMAYEMTQYKGKMCERNSPAVFTERASKQETNAASSVVKGASQ